ncbi:MAG: amidohydrolase family protein, partial [Actinobacteria bacterium]|nr:amidohydrolase family protein [Actinomycetota bacterium]
MRIIAVEEHYTQSRPQLDSQPPHIRERLCDLDQVRIAGMDAAGIDLQVLSLQAPGAQAWAASEAVAQARGENDRLAEAVGRHPGRFAAFAALPTADPEAAAGELERTVRQLGFKGGMVNGHTDGRFLDDQRFWPILAAAESLDVPIYIHPAPPPPAV